MITNVNDVEMYYDECKYKYNYTEMKHSPIQAYSDCSKIL